MRRDIKNKTPKIYTFIFDRPHSQEEENNLKLCLCSFAYRLCGVLGQIKPTLEIPPETT